MRSRVQKWGNSLALRIPKLFADEMGLEENASISMMIQEGALVVVPERKEAWRLDALLAEVTDANRHAEWESDAPAGREEW